MDPFRKDKSRRKRNPFDYFGFEDDFFKDFFDNDLFDDRLFDDFRRMAEEMMRMFLNATPGKPIVHGYKVYFGPDGRPRIEDFGNRSVRSEEGEPIISEEREPLTDVIEGDTEVSVTVEIPGVEKKDIDLRVTETNLEIKVNTPQRKYHKIVEFTCEVKPKTTKATYKNGILDIAIQRKEKKKKDDDTGYRVSIE